MKPILAMVATAVLAGGVSAQPRRIVSAAPGITETLFALGLGDRVVGVSQFCNYPPEAAGRPKVGGYLRPDIEAIVALRPDLAIVQYAPNRVVSQLRRMKIDVLELEHGDMAHAFTAIRLIGERVGAPQRAAELVADIRRRLDAVRRRTAGLPRRSLLFVVGRTPGRLEGLVAVGKGSFLNELIEIAGGVNALAGAVVPYPKISLETVVALNPDVIVDMGDMGGAATITGEHKREVIALWERRTHLEAVRAGRVRVADSDIFVIPGPRMAAAAEEFERMIHPEAAR
jgi:iron complex transport system substrate-binding protein